jgi:tetratricopeptide (TPR) repeat protein
VLAAFAEGVLPPEQRPEVERHVANCPECPVIVGEVTRFLGDAAEEDSERAAPDHRWWYIAAVIAAICVPVVVWRTMSSDPLMHLRSIAAASAVRHYEGRLHDFAYTRFRSTRSTERISVPAALRAEADRLADHGDAADVLHARGIAALMSGDPHKAALLLDKAARSADDDPAILNDLAVAELARASRGVPAALPSALEAANRAVALAPSSPDAHYNRGIALERLSDAVGAAKAYRQALAHETSPQWSAEIRERLQRVENDR